MALVASLQGFTRWFHAIRNGFSAGALFGLAIGMATLAGDYLIGTSSSTPQIVYEGDSLTSGMGGTHPYNYWITTPTYNGLTFNATNIGVSARTLSTMQRQAATNLNPLYSNTAGMNVLVILGGGNDMYVQSGGASPQQTFARLQSFAQHERALGWKVIVATMISNQTLDSEIVTYNNLIRANWPQFADGLADAGSDPRIGPLGAYSNTTYFSGDGIHLNDTGYQILASIVQAAETRVVRVNNLRY